MNQAGVVFDSRTKAVGSVLASWSSVDFSLDACCRCLLVTLWVVPNGLDVGWQGFVWFFQGFTPGVVLEGLLNVFTLSCRHIWSP